jgi:cysteinyl-tRNA synthetase
MALRFYNTLTRRVDDFQPLEGNTVRMYNCGPTVYDYAHIGNYRTFLFQDILRRYLKYKGYELRHVVNLTDVDDNTIRNSQAAGMPLREYTSQYIEAFLVDRQLLNLEDPEFLVRATDHIPEMVKLIQALVDRGFAYASEGSIYFKVAAFPHYGQLAQIDFSGVRAGARVDADRYDKENARDFVLWKAAKEGEPFWETPFGPGRPGWHIECSAMSMKYLGETFDIHSGGSDLIFPHHENEIAQSEAATGKPFVKVWMHAEHLIVNGEKMSKSLGNFYTLRDLIKQGYRPSALRYLLTSVPHRKPLNFTFEGLHQAQQSIERLRNFRFRLTKESFPEGKNDSLQTRAQQARRKFEAALDDNLNTAEALGAIFDMVREGNTAMDRGEFRADDCAAFGDTLARWDRIFAVLGDEDHAKLVKFGFVREAVSPVSVAVEAREAESVRVAEFRSGQPTGYEAEQGIRNGTTPALPVGSLSDEAIEKLVAERAAARRAGDYVRSDEIRANLLKAGVILEDTKAGARWKRK